MVRGGFSEGEIVPPGQITGDVIGARPQLGPATPPYYGGRRGVSSDIDAVSEPMRYAGSDEEAAFNALIPDRYNPHPSNMPDMPPYEYVPSTIDEVATGTGRNTDLDVNMPPQRGAVKNATTGYESTRDMDVEYLAETGDKAALQEARKRPGMWERLKLKMSDETGAVGPGTDDLIKGNREFKTKLAANDKAVEDRLAAWRAKAGLRPVPPKDENIINWFKRKWGESKSRPHPSSLDTSEKLQAWFKEGDEIFRDVLKGSEEAVSDFTGMAARSLPEGHVKNGMRLRNPDWFLEDEVATARQANIDELPDVLDESGLPIAPAQALDDPAFAAHKASSIGKFDATHKPKLGELDESNLLPRMGGRAEQPTAEFAAYQEGGAPLYNVKGGERANSTVSPDTLKELGIDIPETPPYSGKKEIPAPVRQFLEERGVPKSTLDSYTPEQAIENARRMKSEGGFFKIRGANNKDDKSLLGRAFQPSIGTKYEKDFSGWVNNVKSVKVEGILKGKEFKDLDELGIQGIHAFQSGSRSGRLKDVGAYFDQKFKQLKDAGVRVNYRENYLPQIWDEDPAKIKEVYRRLGLRPSFTLDRVFEDYTAGMNAGLKPKFQNIGELIQWYERKANKAVADRQFYDLAKKNEWIKPQGKGGPDWKILDQNHFPSIRVKSKRSGDVRVLPMTAPPELHRLLKNYLDEPGELMQWIADKASLSKNLALSAGIPYTAVNAHGFNILARTVIGNPAQAFTAGKYILNPKSAGKVLDEMLPTAPWAVKRGLTLTTEGYELGDKGSTQLAGKILQKALKKSGEMFEDPLFQNVLPALKLKHFNDLVGDMVKGGMDREMAGTNAAKFTNDLYGGINWEAMGRSKDLQNLGRMMILAPDWLETNVRIGGGMGKALLNPKNPQSKLYNRAARNLIAAYVGANVINFAASGHLMMDNAAGHSLDIELGESESGKVRHFRPFGTAADFLRLPFDIASATLKHSPGGKWQPDFGTTSQTLKNRMSIPASAAFNLTSKRDRFGRPILGKDDYGRPLPASKQVGGALGEITSTFTPPYVKSGIDYAQGEIGGEEALMGTIESPVRYSSKPRGTGRPKRQRR